MLTLATGVVSGCSHGTKGPVSPPLLVPGGGKDGMPLVSQPSSLAWPSIPSSTVALDALPEKCPGQGWHHHGRAIIPGKKTGKWGIIVEPAEWYRLGM